MESNLVIKVKYSDTLRRFNASINENGQLDLDMDTLRAKVFSLFSLPCDADMTLTYIDEDGDTITLVDDNDLADIAGQRLKFLKINVQLNNDKSAKSHTRSSGRSTPVRSPRVQNPLHSALSKLSHDLTSIAASSSPVAAELIDHFSKVGLSYLNQAQQSQGGSVTSNPAGDSEVPATPAATEENVEDGGLLDSVPKSEIKEKASHATGVENVTRGVGPSSISIPSLLAKPVSDCMDVKVNIPDCSMIGSTIVNPLPATSFPPVVDGKIEAKKQKAGHPDCKPPSAAASASSAFSGSPLVNECPFSGIPIPYHTLAPPLVPPPVASYRSRSFNNDAMFGLSPVFHRGVQCDGCGAHPIVGLRYKSRVKYDYDLCSICFAKMGNEADYVKIERPITYRHRRLFQGFHEHNYFVPPPPPPQSKTKLKCGLRALSKLDSCFILDVNVLDGTMMAPNTNFTKIWRMCNTGSLPWPQGTRLVWIGGHKFSNVDFEELEIPENGLAVNEELDVAVDFTSPELPGRYISYWRMATSSGMKFGQKVWVLIQVDADVKDSVSPSLADLNLNLPPNCGLPKAPALVDLNEEPVVDSGLLDKSNSAEASESMKQTVDQQPKDQNLTFPLTDTLLVGHAASASAPPEVPSTVSYPIIDFSEPTPAENSRSFPPVDLVSPVEKFSGSDVENTLLKELEEMGFKQVDLNKEILRMNEYNLGQCVDDLCGVAAEWDPILEELQEMGFHDTEMNRKLLKKNNGSIKRVVMDLLTGEKA